MEQRRLYRSQSDKVVGGVAGGLGQYFNIDPVMLRVGFALLFLFGGSGLLIYLILWIAVPSNPYEKPGQANMENAEGSDRQYMRSTEDEVKERKKNGGLIAGLVLITVGFLFLLERFFDQFDFGKLWPVVLIVVGFALIAGGLKSFRKDQ